VLFNSLTTKTGHRYAPFIYDAWNSQETLSIISKIAGIDLIPVINFEIGHINISVKSEREAKEEVANLTRAKQSFADDEGIGGCPWEDDKPVVDWHHDSYPFVCVTMLSDCTNMVGGETALRTGRGEIMKVRGPQKVCPTNATDLLRSTHDNRVALWCSKAATSLIKLSELWVRKSASLW
jgi:hypothetical protein